MPDLESRIAALSPAKRALLERRLRERADRFEAEPILPRSSADRPPASFSQQRLWFLDQFNPGSAAYNMSRGIRIEGPLDQAVLERTLTEIVRRHETLRTTFAVENDAPVQVIHAPAPVAVRRIDLTTIPDSEKQAEIFRLMSEEAGRPFDLATGPLFRASLLRLEPEHHVLILSIHHIISDGWSMGVLYSELFALYDSFVQGHASPLPPLPIQYGDFALWQRQRLQGDTLLNQLNYWREALRDLPTLELPTDYSRPPMQTFTGAIVRIQLPRNLVERLKVVSRQEGATLFMTLLAAFQALLHRYTGQDDIVVGSPIAGRTRVEMEGLIGFFVNMLVLRTSLSGDPTFRQLLQRVEKVAHGAYAHQDIPFEKLVEELHPRRDPSRNPLFQVVLALQNTPRYAPSLSGLNIARINSTQAPSRFDLEAHFMENEDAIEGLIVYNTSLFDAKTIDRMMGNFRMLLEGIAADPDRLLSELPLLTEKERQQQLLEWNDTTTSYARDACVHELVEHQVKTTPDALAVAYGKQRVTYRQLNDRSNQLAHYLQSLGVGPDMRVGVCIERSVQMIVAFLAVLKTGAAYVPLEPSYPPERLAFMLDDANVSVLLTEEKLRSNLSEVQAPVVCLDVQRFDNMPRKNLAGRTNATDLAYVIYTSGSTGLPKGVAVPHRAIVRLVRNTNYVEFMPADRIAQASNASFDAATFEIWGALLNGASLIGIPQEVLLSPKRFARTIREQKVSTLFLTTALFHEIAHEAPTAFQPLRYLLFGGQTCDPKWVRRVVQSGPPQHLLNVYGPTESTTFATWHRVESVDEFATTVPIGRPISNTQLYVLDRHLQPVPVGVIGQLYIGGDGLAREYLNRPELTGEKFIVCPLHNNASVLLYKTGDFGRYRPDGTIDFVGRIDQQVKIRGFRIELQEIEAVLSQHPGVSKSAVIARQMDGSEKRLLAYFVPTEGAQPLIESLRAFLREKLPDYMVPSFFVALESLPITANGKIDYAALPDPESDSDPTDRRAEEPRTSIEEGIGQIWKELLGVKRVSIHDNFFDLGGHSLLGIQLIARLEKRFGKNLPVAVLFQSPTIHQLGKILRNGNSVASWDSLIPVQLEGSKTPFFWVHGDMSNAVLPAYLGSDQPLYSLEHQARDGRPAEYTEVQTIAKQYLDEVRGVRPHGPYLLGGYSFGSLVAYEMAQQLKRQGEDVPLLFMLDPPGCVRVNHSRTAIRGELQRHFREIAGRPLREKFNYLWLRVAGYMNQRAARMRKAFNRIRWNVYLWSGRRLPASLRSPYILQIYVLAAKNYAPQPYSGTVAIFKALPGPYRPEWDWKKFITGPLQIYERTGDHMDLRKEPHLRHWAVRLKELLDRVQEQVPHL